MKRTRSSFMRFAATLAATLTLVGSHALAANDINAQWTIEVPPLDAPDTSTGPSVAADGGALAGTATLTGFHTSAASDWTTPAGNGSANSYSVNTWTAGDYFQLQTSTLGASNIGLQFDQVSSTTGPRDFIIQYSTDGTTFTNFGNYIVQPNAVPAWSSLGAVAPAGLDTYNFDLRGITALNNVANVYLRLTAASPIVAASPGSTAAAGGTDRVDNIFIYSDYDPALAPVPQPPAPPVLPATGNIVFGLNSNRSKTTLELLQGTPVASGGSKTTPYSAWTATAFIQGVKFDNLGTAHNSKGNLLGVDFGTSAAGGSIYSFATQGSVPAPAGQLIGNTTGTGESAVDTTRFAGLSVSPNNNKVAVTGSDKGTVIVYDYTPGNTMGAGAALANGRQSALDTLPKTSQGTAWLNNDTLLAFSTTGILYEVDSTSMVATQKATVTTNSLTTQTTALAYNPDVSQYVYALHGGFTAATSTTAAESQSTLFIFDPTNNYSTINTVDLSVNANTVRDLALDANGNLFISRTAASISIILDAAANAAMLAGNTDVAWYQSDVFNSTFNGLDIGFAPPAGLAGDYNNSGTVDAADYVVWRNDPGSFGGAGGYNTWRANFGSTAGAGLGNAAAVPEPATALLVLVGLAALGLKRRAA